MQYEKIYTRWIKNDVEKSTVNIRFLGFCGISGGGSKMAPVAVAQQ